jgi:UDP-N-acetyl-D-glucosamine dehydrogenase
MDKINLQRVCIQGLGFVGAAMAVAVASAKDRNGNLLFDVVGVDRDTPAGRERVDLLNRGQFPFPTSDKSLEDATRFVRECGNLSASTDKRCFNSADIIVIDVALDIPFYEERPKLEMATFEGAIRDVAGQIQPDTLVLVETTVPPGTCEKVVAPRIAEVLEERGIDPNSVHLAHSYERVMPGNKYFESITKFWRVYAGQTEEAANRCAEFLSKVIDIENYPLTRLSSMTASETAKVLENTYRAMNIAFIDEWTKFAEVVDIDLFEVIDAIKVRPTHSNIRYPGLGVGGYCLTKDPAFSEVSATQLFSVEDLAFPFSNLALSVNQNMPYHTAQRVIKALDSDIGKKNILVLGVSYREGVGDTRYSASETLVRGLEQDGAIVIAYDPYLRYWPELDRQLPEYLPDADQFDAVVLAVAHREFSNIDFVEWARDSKPVLIDAANLLSKEGRVMLRAAGVRVESIGRGAGL